MKKLFLLFFLPFLPLLAHADAVEIDGIYYNLIEKGNIAEVTHRPIDTYSGDIVIPASVRYNGTEYKVTKVGNHAFYFCVGITSLTLPNSITKIGEYAFEWCKSLTSISIPNSVTYIEAFAFQACDLTEVHISDIAAWCRIRFDSRDSNPLTCAQHLYLGDDEINELVIPIGVTTIGKYAFNICRNLTSLSIPNSVTGIENEAFMECSGLTEINLSNSVTKIGDNAFNNCI